MREMAAGTEARVSAWEGTRVPATVGALVESVAAVLAAASPAAAVDDPRGEALDLVAALAGVPRWWGVRHRERALASVERGLAARAHAAARRRAGGAPFQYAVGTAPFRALTLTVDARVLIPRPETELLVDLVLQHVAPGGTAADVGTGSGAIALALSSEGSFVRVLATDVSLDALAVAAENVQRCAPVLRAPIELRAGSLGEPLRGERLRALVSNPPYISFADAPTLPALVRDWEPPLALYAGADGLRAGAAIARQGAGLLERGGLLALETDSRRAVELATMVSDVGAYEDVRVVQDLTGRDRFVVALCKETEG